MMHESGNKPVGVIQVDNPIAFKGDDGGGSRSIEQTPSLTGPRPARPSGAWLDGIVPAPNAPHPAAWPVSGRGQHASRCAHAEGPTLATAGGGKPAPGFRFDRIVTPDGYAWWYVDALSDDGRHGITLIGFIGSVFSPYYAWRRRQGPADPTEHCALNVALYGECKAWAMTERSAGALCRTPDECVIGPSALCWNGDVLTIHINERTMPFGRKLRGVVQVRPQAFTAATFALDAQGLHRWSPMAPRAHVEVNLENPALNWSGSGYLDSNEGDAPLEQSFASWHWSRAAIGADTAILYDVRPISGPGAVLSLLIDHAGTVLPFETPPPLALPRTRWGVTRVTRAAAGTASVQRTLEDTPFYARSVLETRVLGQAAVAMHESLSLTRFRKPLVQAMLPFRMPRTGRKAVSL